MEEDQAKARLYATTTNESLVYCSSSDPQQCAAVTVSNQKQACWRWSYNLC